MKLVLGIVCAGVVGAAGCGAGARLKVGPSLAGGHPGATATVEGQVLWGTDQRAVVMGAQIGGGYHDELGPTLLLGMSVGAAWDEGRWMATGGMLGYLPRGTGDGGTGDGDEEGGLVYAGEVGYAVARRVDNGREGCPPVGRGSYHGYRVRLQELRVGAAGGAAPGASFAWLPVSVGLVSWSLACPYTGR